MLSPNVMDLMVGRNVGSRDVCELDVQMHQAEAHHEPGRRIERLIRSARHLLSIAL